MNSYQRILVPVPAGSHGDVLLHRAAGLSHAQGSQMLVVHVIDTRSGFEPDGPAGVLPGEAAARRVSEMKRRLDLQLARNNLSWAEAKVVWGEPKVRLAEIIHAWKPDIIVACDGDLPQGIAPGADILTIGCTSWLRRLTRVRPQPALLHA